MAKHGVMLALGAILIGAFGVGLCMGPPKGKDSPAPTPSATTDFPLQTGVQS